MVILISSSSLFSVEHEHEQSNVEWKRDQTGSNIMHNSTGNLSLI